MWHSGRVAAQGIGADGAPEVGPEPRPSHLGEQTIAFRDEFGLSQTEFIDLLKRNGFQTANAVSLHRWEKRGVNASLVHTKVVTEAMQAIRGRIANALARDTTDPDDLINFVVTRLRAGRASANPSIKRR